MLEWLPLLGALAALTLAAALLLSNVRRLRALRRLQLRLDAVASEQRLVENLRAQLAAGQALAENLVAGGTGTVRAVHKGIAAIPFGILERIPVTRDTTRVVRKIHDLISDGVYGGIGVTNKLLHEAARDALKPSVNPADDEET